MLDLFAVCISVFVFGGGTPMLLSLARSVARSWWCDIWAAGRQQPHMD